MATPCPYCEKQGLPILLTRYGIAPEKAFMARPGKPPVTQSAPRAASSVGDPEPAIPLGKTSEAFYTVRSLHGGYVYAYYEVTRSWEAYAVDGEGHLMQVPLGEMPPQPQPFHPACSRSMQKVANGALLTVQDPKTAGKVWFGFSDAWWTAAVRKDNESESVRKLHMRCVDIQGWYNDHRPAKAPPHTSPIADVDTVVADYALRGNDGPRLFFWSPFPALKADPSMPDRAGILKIESQRLLKDKGLVVVLEDPVAILQEISAYIDKRWINFLSQVDDKDSVHPGQTWHRKAALSSALETLRLHVEREAEASVYADARGMARQTMANGGLAFLVPGYQKLTQPILDQKVTPAELEAARKKRWEPHAVLFDPNQRKDFETRYKSASDLHDANYATPLANAHATWLRSATLHAVFDHHFDMQDINSGIAFSGVALACMAGTGGLGACMQVYRDWFNQPLDKSPLWRGMLLNHHPLIQVVDTASGSSSAPFANIDDWTNLDATYASAVGKIKALGEQISSKARAPGVRSDVIKNVDVLPAFLQELGDAAPKWLLNGDRKAGALLATLGMRGGQHVRWVQVIGTRRDLYSAVLQVSIESQKGRGISLGNLQYSLNDQLRTFEIEGVNLDEQIQFWTVVFDEEAQGNLAKQGITPAQRGAGLGKAVKVITAGEFQESTLSKAIEYATHPGALAGVGLVLAALGLHSAGSADSAMKNLQGRAALKIGALYSGGMGSLLDLVRVGAKAAGKSGRIPMLSPWLGARLESKGFLIWEGLGGFAAGAGTIVMGVIDVLNVREAYSRNQKGMVVLYTINASAEMVAGGLTAVNGLSLILRGVALFAEFNPVIFGLTLVILVVSVVIEIEKDPPTMEWVRQCLWGKENNYQSEVEETDNYNKALSG
ncbi:T6SS effector BTH_I2691 family protein [Paraburkholderia bannensis]|uniref:T6SS effector BTH_I2691 family protein n=1 Tax=Paraburkholderia bannensis TaxID=765414 RepID=UPI002AB792B5|nr:T6SS effector BTH_I2691 family protein [Paraburkholderia bannensis]